MTDSNSALLRIMKCLDPVSDRVTTGERAGIAAKIIRVLKMDAESLIARMEGSIVQQASYNGGLLVEIGTEDLRTLIAFAREGFFAKFESNPA